MKEDELLVLSHQQVRTLVDVNQDFITQFGYELFADILVDYDSFLFEGKMIDFDKRIDLADENALKIMFIAFACGWLKSLANNRKTVH